MSLGTIESLDRADAVDRVKARESSSFASNGEPSRRQPLWVPEDIEAPESWTLASFEDLLPHGMA